MDNVVAIGASRSLPDTSDLWDALTMATIAIHRWWDVCVRIDSGHVSWEGESTYPPEPHIRFLDIEMPVSAIVGKARVLSGALRPGRPVLAYLALLLEEDPENPIQTVDDFCDLLESLLENVDQMRSERRKKAGRP